MTSTMESAPLLNRAASIAGQVHLSLVSSWGLGILVHNLALNRAGLISVIIEFILTLARSTDQNIESFGSSRWGWLRWAPWHLIRSETFH